MQDKFNFIIDETTISSERYNYCKDENYAPVVYGVDSNFIMHAGISALSCIKNTFGVKLNVIVVTSCEDKLEFSKLSTLVSGTPHALTIVVISDAMFAHLPATRAFPASVYFRLLAPILFKEYRFLLYLDADIVALDSVQRLLQQDAPMNVASCVVQEPCEQEKLSFAIGISEGNYFNSGMLYINTKIWNENKISQKVYKILTESGSSFKYFDQDALNIALQGKVKYLDPKYNRQIKAGHTKKDLNVIPANDTVLLHYVGKDKPWQRWNQQAISIYYRNYLSVSPWRNVILPNPVVAKDIKKYYRALWHKKSYANSLLWFSKFLLVQIIERLRTYP